MRVLLAVFGVKINLRKNEQILSNFGGNIDFLKLYHEFALHVLQNVWHWDRKDKPTLSLTCVSDTLPVISESTREVYGFFDAGRDGDRFKVRNFRVEKSDTTHIDPEHSSIREAFHYMYVPKGRSRGYLVLQVPEGQGIKHLVNHALNEFLRIKGLSSYRVEISNLINDKVFHRMMDTGFFKELILTKYGLPEELDSYNNNDVKPVVMRGTMKTIFQATDLSGSWKEKARSIFNLGRVKKAQEGNQQIFVEIMGHKDEYDEVAIKLDLNGKQKTFHVANSNRTLPDLDVTSNVKRKANGRLDVNDLLIQAKDLIEDVSDKVDFNDIQS